MAPLTQVGSGHPLPEKPRQLGPPPTFSYWGLEWSWGLEGPKLPHHHRSRGRELAGANVPGARDRVAPQPLGTAPAGASLHRAGGRELTSSWRARAHGAEPSLVRWDLAAVSGPTQVPWQGERRPLSPGWQPPRRARPGKRGRAGSPWTRPSPASEGARGRWEPAGTGSGPAQSSARLAQSRGLGHPPICQQNPGVCIACRPRGPPSQHNPAAAAGARQDPQHSPDTVNTLQRRPSAFLSFPAGLEGDLASATPSSQLTFLAPHFPVQSRA